METQTLFAYRLQGTRHDGGTPMGLLKASLAMAVEGNETRDEVLEAIRRLTSIQP
jgi:UTP-glucose-1-phosphate uridylyltransferase